MRNLQALSLREGPAEPFDDKIVARNFTGTVLFPEFNVGLPVRNGEGFKGWEIAAEAELVVEFGKRNFSITTRIIEGVVKVEEDV